MKKDNNDGKEEFFVKEFYEALMELTKNALEAAKYIESNPDMDKEVKEILKKCTTSAGKMGALLMLVR